MHHKRISMTVGSDPRTHERPDHVVATVECLASIMDRMLSGDPPEQLSDELSRLARIIGRKQ